MTARPRHPRGSIYVLVLSISMLVGVIGMGALLAARVQLRNARAQVDFATARLCARTGLEVALLRIKQDPTWRTDLGNGAWFTNTPAGQGSFSVSAADALGGNVATAPAQNPVVLTCTGTKGSAVYSMQVQVQVTSGSLSCIAVAACSGSDTTLSKCALASNQVVSANGALNVSGDSSFNAIGQAVGLIVTSSAYVKSQHTIAQPLALPDPVHVFDGYTANGTAISYASLYQSNQTNMVSNPSFETNTAGWYVYSPSSSSVTLSLDTSQHQDGTKSLLISGRSGSGDVPATDLPLMSIRNGDTYAVKVPVYGSALLGLGSVQATIVLQTSNGTQSFSTPGVSFPLLGAGWVVPQGNIMLSWTGTLNKATLTLTCSGSSNLNIDALSMTDTSLPSGAYVMDRVLLSPTSNPYGAANANGIYILNCGNKPVTIGACRIVGTLILQGLGSGSVIQGPITMEPAVAGYPALLTDSSLTMTFDANAGLSEYTYGANFNPPNTPYPFVNGSSNTTAADGFQSAINGLVYCGGDLTLSGNPCFNGNVITAGKLILNGPSATLNYASGSTLNPPPGFGATIPIPMPASGTWQRVTH